jgi:lysyl-tRNA synthetase class II
MKMEKYDAFNDAELRYRMRYVDLTVTCERNVYQENKMFNAMRSFFNDRGYLEVETLFYNLFWRCCSASVYHTPQLS